eukprot:scaffold901_cov167-Amphora_coffeaeformis.AAC.19
MMSGGSIMPAPMNQNAHPRSRPEDAANYVTVRLYDFKTPVAAAMLDAGFDPVGNDGSVDEC